MRGRGTSRDSRQVHCAPRSSPAHAAVGARQERQEPQSHRLRTPPGGFKPICLSLSRTRECTGTGRELGGRRPARPCRHARTGPPALALPRPRLRRHNASTLGDRRSSPNLPCRTGLPARPTQAVGNCRARSNHKCAGTTGGDSAAWAVFRPGDLEMTRFGVLRWCMRVFMPQAEAGVRCLRLTSFFLGFHSARRDRPDVRNSGGFARSHEWPSRSQAGNGTADKTRLAPREGPCSEQAFGGARSR